MYLMEALMSQFKFNDILDQVPDALAVQGSMLWIWNADKIPPHLGLSSKGSYYSLKVKGKDSAVPVADLLDRLSRKPIPTLCVQLKDEMVDLAHYFTKYDKAQADGTTCLQPIREALQIPSARLLSELLMNLEEQKKIEKVYGMYLPNNFEGIPAYGIEDIHRRLKVLANG